MNFVRILFVFGISFLFVTINAQTINDNISSIEKNKNSVQSKLDELDKKVRQLSNVSDKNAQNIQSLAQRNESLCGSIDSLKTVCDSLGKIQTSDKADISGKIKDTNDALDFNKTMLESRTLWGGVVIFSIFAVLFLVYLLLTRKIKNGTSSIDDVRKAQDALQTAQTKMQEESVKLDNKLLELAEKQMQTIPVATESNTADHSLALKVADEIVRIEMNLSRMDASIKGYKQLAKAVQRIKDNFCANGYEIVDMLGKTYNAGMKVVANFISDDNLALGSQIITGIVKPQINYNGQMIQAAQITVSQNI